jgi:hypothetical protein
MCWLSCINCITPTPTTHKRNPSDSIPSHPYPQTKSVERFGFVHDIISRPEKEGKTRKEAPILGMEQGNNFTADGVACAAWRHMCAYAWGWDSVCLVSFKAKALCLFLRRFCRSIVLLVIIRCSI